MENYTIDLAQLGRKEVARPIGSTPDVNLENHKAEKGDAGLDEGVAGRDEEDMGDFMGNYSLDLGGLGEKPSSVLVEDRQQEREEVPSEDDGPEDFTVNLDKWMRGAEKWKKERDDGPAAREIADEAREDLDQPEVRAEDVPAEESTFEPLGTSTPAPLGHHDVIQEGVEEGGEELAPQFSRLSTEMLQDQAAEEVFDRISALQAEVESMRMEEENRRLTFSELQQENESLKQDYKDLRVEGKNLRSSYDALQGENDDLKQCYEGLKERLQKVEHEPSVDSSSRVGSLRAKFEPAVQELAAVKAEAETDRRASDARITTLESELGILREEAKHHQAEIATITEANYMRTEDLEAELESERSKVAFELNKVRLLEENAIALTKSTRAKDDATLAITSNAQVLKNELDHAQAELRETRRILEDVENENDRLAQQNERQAQDMIDLENVMDNKMAEGRAADDTAEKLGSEIFTAQDDEAGPKFSKAAHEATIEALRQEQQTTSSSLNASHAKELQTVRSALLKAGQGMQEREARLVKAHNEELAFLKQQFATLKEQQAKATPPANTDLEKELRSTIRVLSTKLDGSNAALAAARLETEDARAKAEDVQRTNAMVNAELEARFAETVDAREREWRRRIALLFRERDRMGKALMWGWGREEVGVREEKERGQGYRYKFVDR